MEEIKASAGQSLPLQAERGGAPIVLTLTPDDVGGVGRIGAQLQPMGREAFRAPRGPLEPIRQANHDFLLLTGRTISWIRHPDHPVQRNRLPGVRVR